MKLQVWQIDAWKDPDGWRYNNSIPIGDIEVNGEPTKRKILKALRDKEWLDHKRYIVDDYFTFEGTWMVKMPNDMPLYDLLEIV